MPLAYAYAFRRLLLFFFTLSLDMLLLRATRCYMPCHLLLLLLRYY